MSDQETKDKKQDDKKKAVSGSKVSSRKYLFDLHLFDEPDIDESENEEPEDLPPPPPTYTQEELDQATEKARLQAFEEGKAKAMKESAASLEQKTHDTFQNVAGKLDHLMQAEHVRDEQFQQDALKMTLSAMSKLFPHYIQHEGYKEIERFVLEVVKRQEKTSELTIFVASDVAKKVEEMVNTHASISEHIIYVKGDADLAEGDCRIEWPSGGAVRDPNSLEKQINEVVQEYLAHEPNTDQNENGHKKSEETSKQDDHLSELAGEENKTGMEHTDHTLNEDNKNHNKDHPGEEEGSEEP